MDCKRNKWNCKEGGDGERFQKRKVRVACLAETKLKGNGEVSCCGENGIIASAQEMERARERVAILLNDAWHSAVLDFECFSSRILWIKFKFSRFNFVPLCIFIIYS